MRIKLVKKRLLEYTRFIWSWLVTSGGLCKHDKETFALIKQMDLLTDNRSASHWLYFTPLDESSK
jgi:hypothetical protein